VLAGRHIIDKGEKRMKPIILNSGQLMDKILDALDRKLPCPVVSLGASETFVLAQESVLSVRKIMRHAEAQVANRGAQRGQEHRGVRFPNLKARDTLAEALRKIDIVGFNLTIRDHNSGLLTEQVLEHYGLWPKYTFEAYIRRVIMFSQQEKFERMLQGRNILIVAGYADEVAAAMDKRLKDKLELRIAGAVKIHEFEEIPRVIREMHRIQFDLALLAAGLNAIILAAHIAEEHGKVSFDLGQGMETLISGRVQDKYNFLANTIGIGNLMKM
jgi:hypothetical protein